MLPGASALYAVLECGLVDTVAALSQCSCARLSSETADGHLLPSTRANYADLQAVVAYLDSLGLHAWLPRIALFCPYVFAARPERDLQPVVAYLRQEMAMSAQV